MKVRIEGRYGYATASDMRRLLGLGDGVLPVAGLPVRDIQGVQVYVRPIAPLQPGQRKRCAHRIIAICNCGVHVPTGRLHQHKCKPELVTAFEQGQRDREQGWSPIPWVDSEAFRFAYNRGYNRPRT